MAWRGKHDALHVKPEVMLANAEGSNMAFEGGPRVAATTLLYFVNVADIAGHPSTLLETHLHQPDDARDNALLASRTYSHDLQLEGFHGVEASVQVSHFNESMCLHVQGRFPPATNFIDLPPHSRPRALLLSPPAPLALLPQPPPSRSLRRCLPAEGDEDVSGGHEPL